MYLATTYAELTTGLKGLPSMPQETGMLFVLPYDQAVTITTQGLNFPIDIVFIASNLEVTGVALGVYPDYLVTSEDRVRYVLEVNSGEAGCVTAGTRVSIAVFEPAGASSSESGITGLIPPVINVATMLMGVALVGKLGKTVADVAFKKPKPKKERPLIYGPKGEQLLPGVAIMPRLPAEASKDLQFFEYVRDLVKLGETITDEEARQMWQAWQSRQPQTLAPAGSKSERPLQTQPNPVGQKPARDEVEIGTWAERDRIGIWLTDRKSGQAIAQWWDEDAREMFDQGWFKPGDIRQQTITGRAFEESVLDYAESMGIIAGSGKYLPETAKDAWYWTAVNKDTGEIVESHAPYTSSGRALRGGRAFVTRHWKGSGLVEVWRQPNRYSADLKIEPVACEMVTAEKPAVIPVEPRQPQPGEPELEFLPDSPEFLAYTIEDIGYRDKIDNAFCQAIARAKGR